MGSGLGYAAALQHDDAVGMDHRCQAMRDDKVVRPSLTGPRLLHQRF